MISKLKNDNNNNDNNNNNNYYNRTTTNVFDNTENNAPNYDPEICAVDLFDNPYFYNNWQDIADRYANKRTTLFHNDSVLAVLERYKSKDELDTTFSDIGIYPYRVIPYWEKSRESIESKLNGLLLTKGGENLSNQINLINLNHRELPILNSLRKTNEAVNKRNSDIIYVLGLSGSGKTYFAVKDISGEKTIDNKLKSMTFYLQATEIHVPEAKPSGIPENVMQIVKESINKHLKHQKIVDKLNMRLSLIIDEAGSPVFDGYFEIFDNLECIHSEMRKIATKCRLIIAGTVLTAQNVNSQSQAKKYR